MVRGIDIKHVCVCLRFGWESDSSPKEKIKNSPVIKVASYPSLSRSAQFQLWKSHILGFPSIPGKTREFFFLSVPCIAQQSKGKLPHFQKLPTPLMIPT
jgi:hypothetical protein